MHKIRVEIKRLVCASSCLFFSHATHTHIFHISRGSGGLRSGSGSDDIEHYAWGLIKKCKGKGLYTAADEGKCCGYDSDNPQIISCEAYPRARVFKKCDGSFQCCEGVTGACANKADGSTCHDFRTKPMEYLTITAHTGGVCQKQNKGKYASTPSCESYCDSPIRKGTHT